MCNMRKNVGPWPQSVRLKLEKLKTEIECDVDDVTLYERIYILMWRYNIVVYNDYILHECDVELMLQQ